MRKWKMWQQPRSNNLREGLGYLRYAALWRQYDRGQRRNYRHSDFNGARYWKRAMEIIQHPSKCTLYHADPYVFYQSPSQYKIYSGHR